MRKTLRRERRARRWAETLSLIEWLLLSALVGAATAALVTAL